MSLWLCIYMKKPFWSWKSGNSAISWPKSIHVSFHKKKEIYILHTSSKLFLWLKNFYKIPLRKKREVKEVWVDRRTNSNNTFWKVTEKNSIMIPWFHACKLYITDLLVTQSMLQHWPNRTELRSMDSYIQILLRFQKCKQKVPPPSLLSNEKSPFTPQRKIFLILWGIKGDFLG